MGTPFKYPRDRLLRIRGIASEELLRDPRIHNDKNDRRGITVLKDGNTTGLTIGHIAGMVSFVRGTEGMESIELGVYNVDREEVFSKEGDSGSLVVDVHGRMVGLMHAGTMMEMSDGSEMDVTYVTPMYWLWPHITKKYVHADPNCQAW